MRLRVERSFVGTQFQLAAIQVSPSIVDLCRIRKAKQKLQRNPSSLYPYCFWSGWGSLCPESPQALAFRKPLRPLRATGRAFQPQLHGVKGLLGDSSGAFRLKATARSLL